MRGEKNHFNVIELTNLQAQALGLQLHNAQNSICL